MTGLKTYTQYLVSLSVYNPEGDGPPTVVVVMTDEGGKNRLKVSFDRHLLKVNQKMKELKGYGSPRCVILEPII